MKKVLLTVIVFLFALSAQAQGFRIGMSGGINSTWLMNKNVFDQGDDLDIASSFGGRLGLDAIYSFNDKIGLSVGINFISTHNQKYTGENSSGSYSYDAKTKLNYLDIPILFRLTAQSGPYFEIGPQIGILGSAKEDFEESPNSGDNYTNYNVKNGFNTTNVALILGFGVDIDVLEKLYITTGLRLGYGFSDVTKEYGSSTELYNSTESFTTNAAHIDDNNQFNYEKTTRVFGGLHLGVSYKFGGD